MWGRCFAGKPKPSRVWPTNSQNGRGSSLVTKYACPANWDLRSRASAAYVPKLRCVSSDGQGMCLIRPLGQAVAKGGGVGVHAPVACMLAVGQLRCSFVISCIKGMPEGRTANRGALKPCASWIGLKTLIVLVQTQLL